MGEAILTSAYVYEHSDGMLTAHHCSVFREGKVCRILPDEGCMRSVHLNLRSRGTVVVKFTDQEVKQEIQSEWMLADGPDK